MKRILSVLMLALMLQGCLWQTINSFEIKDAFEKCKSVNAELISISEDAPGFTTVKCSNGKFFDVI